MLLINCTVIISFLSYCFIYLSISFNLTKSNSMIRVTFKVKCEFGFRMGWHRLQDTH